MHRPSIVYCRFPGLLAYAARMEHGGLVAESPLVVSEGRGVRDACPLALSRGVKPGSSALQARHLCPLALVIPVETINHASFTIAFLDRLADISPIVEPVAPDTAFADLSGERRTAWKASLRSWAEATFGLPPVFGFGMSRLAARACGEAGLPASCLADASVTHLWPEDPKVAARLQRLGLVTFGAVADLPESVLVHQFGKMGRLLHRRAQGVDLTPVRSLYPPPRADVRLDLAEHPIAEVQRLDAVLSRLAARAALQLRHMGRHGRRLVLRFDMERGEVRQERLLPLPTQTESDILRAARSLASQVRITAPIIAVRILVDDTDVPVAQTLTLFPDKTQDRENILRATRRRLHARFGTRSLLRLSELSVPLRDERRRLAEEAFGMP